MAKIPSTEKTNDFIYRMEVKSGTSLRADDPHLLIIEEFVGPAGSLHSMDITILRDGQRVDEVEFRSFEHSRQPNITYIKLVFYDHAHNVVRHNYLLTIVLRYFAS